MELDIPTLVAGIGSTYYIYIYIYIYMVVPHIVTKQYNKFRTKKTTVPGERSKMSEIIIYIYV
jgi:hypothetical protein